LPVLKEEAWRELLEGYPEGDFIGTLCGAVKHGLRLGYVGPLLTSGRMTGRNLPMDNIGTQHIASKLDSRLQQELIAVHDPSSLPPFTFLTIGTVPKPNSDKLCTIHHLSHPCSNRSLVNDSIDRKWVPMKYEGLDRLFNQVREGRQTEKNMEIWKIDLANTF
jgi:hypothetical protein